MRNLVHIIIAWAIALTFSFLHHPLQTMILHGMFLDKPFHFYFGWLSWYRIIELLIFTVSGFLAGICTTILVAGQNRCFWPAITGILMIVIYSNLIKVGVHGEVNIIEYIYIYSRPVMFLVGALLSALIYTKKAANKTLQGT